MFARNTDIDKIPKVFLIILDGFGDGKDYPFNAIKNAKMPFYKELCQTYPRAQLLTCGEAVGLPARVMGNSEVGHTNMGAGRIVYQELTRIQKSIHDGGFFRNKTLLDAVERVQKSGGCLHLMGLLSDAGVHSHTDHLKALIKLAAEKTPITLHLFTDGRDTPQTAGIDYIRDLGEFLKQYPKVVIGSVSGRYFAMDRDSRWERIEKAWKVLVGESQAYSFQTQNGVDAAMDLVEKSYDQATTDEFIIPTRFEPKEGRGFVTDKDAVIFFNFRADRARQLTRAFAEEGFSFFKRNPYPKLVNYVCFTQYDKKFNLPVAFPPQELTHPFPELLEEKKLKQLRIAETEKYAHVTFFFNAGREQPYEGEDRILIPSPKDVATYDLKPEMSALEITEEVTKRLLLNQYHFCLLNYANPDMVGHTGNYEAALKAMVTIDSCLQKAIKAALQENYTILITADHGNIEEMRDEHDQVHTQHTLNPVPLHLISKSLHYGLTDGILADLAPTIIQIMGFKKPDEMTGKSLLKSARK